MNYDILQDLKQFISSTVSQATADLAKDISDLETNIDKRFNEVMAAVSDGVTESHDAVQQQFDDHEQRIVNLEAEIAR